jgi:peptidoglycan/LPS O-acetylase OafA/YrhL
VRFFFVISGFLITTLLLRDLDEHGKIRLKQFYIRRALRIFPASFAYIAIIYACYVSGLLDLTLKLGSRTHSSPYPDLLHALTYTANYNHDYNWYLNHLWSLSVEEQFYLLWPGLLVLLGVTRGLKGCALVLLMAPAIRGAMYLWGGGPNIALSREFQAVADGLSTGCLLSLMHNRLSGTRYVQWLAHPLTLTAGVLGVAIGYASALMAPIFAYVVGQTVANIGTALIVDYAIRFPGSLFGSVLKLRPMVAIGAISYSLYLWQEPFLFFKSNAWATRFPQNVALAFAAATLSYLLIERPFQRRRAAYAGENVAKASVAGADGERAVRSEPGPIGIQVQDA